MTRLVVALLAVTVVGTAAYWIGFFAAGETLHASTTDAYAAFERAFPVADGWMATCAAVAAVGLVRRRAWATPAGIAAGSALVYLGLMDVTFDVEQGLYAQRSGAMAVELAINVFCLAVGPFLIGWFALTPPRG